MRTRFAVALGLVLAGVALAAPAAAWEWPTWIDGLLFNAAERTDAGRRALDGGDAAGAVERFESARRLAPDDPVTGYNAGTARLAAERADAAPLLAEAASAGIPEVGARASYNLGNAHFGASDFGAAADAYRDALRADPAFADAKHNLELALRRLQEQSSPPQPSPENQDQNQEQQEQEKKESEGQKEQEKKPGEGEDEQQKPQEEPGDKGEEKPQPPAPGEGQPKPQESPLPQFEQQEDMTAEEAAAILSAVENLERSDRRKEALQAMKKNARGKKDW